MPAYVIESASCNFCIPKSNQSDMCCCNCQFCSAGTSEYVDHKAGTVGTCGSSMCESLAEYWCVIRLKNVINNCHVQGTVPAVVAGCLESSSPVVSVRTVSLHEQTWACLGRLAAHGLSVTQLAFSADGRHLLSTSRDRSFAVFSRPASSPAGGPRMLETPCPAVSTRCLA